MYKNNPNKRLPVINNINDNNLSKRLTIINNTNIITI